MRAVGEGERVYQIRLGSVGAESHRGGRERERQKRRSKEVKETCSGSMQGKKAREGGGGMRTEGGMEI